MLLPKIPPKNKEKEYLKIISLSYGFDANQFDILYSYFKEDIYLLFSILENKVIKFHSIEKLNDYLKMMYIVDFIDSEDNGDIPIVDRFDIISNEFKITSNKAFQLYEEYTQNYKNKL